MQNKQEIVSGVKKWMQWWIGQRRKKLEEQLNETMSINPPPYTQLLDFM